MNSQTIEHIMNIYSSMSQAAFFEIYNQSGMDHELIGHVYNFLAGQDYGEAAAVNIQLQCAKARSGILFGRNWRRILTIMPIVLGYHKGLDHLK